MDLNTILVRMQNAKANIEKTKKTLERHQKQLEKYAKQLDERGIDYSDLPKARQLLAASNRHEDYWLLCDYDNKLDDIRNNEKKLAELKEKLQQYTQQHKTEAARQDIPHIPALEEFLSSWKVSAANWYRDLVTGYRTYIAQCRATRKEIRDKYEPHTFQHRKEIEAEEKEAEVDEASVKSYVRYNFGADVVELSRYGSCGEERFENELEDMLSKEVNRKRLDLYYRCTGAVGVITDASGLKVGNNGSLNGFVTGENGKAELRTVLASGPVQCLHYRVMVIPVREKESLSIRIGRAEKRSNAGSGTTSPAVQKEDRETSR